ncbi:hypothetical protein A5699_00575 [Mycobacterium sp. E802]|uniref:hypothetical protein n=1 Tax=Mycobacterium sp. E802 TaxID=1834152 RepID=UPI0007FD3A2A|nr:hypothetical protein [Mycobacterium sp. E802]OBG81110.1 hypothetical protein A5699_00575 [Mycobacterium sp. E802]
MNQPLLGSRALATGFLTDHDLRTNYQPVYRNVYLANDVDLTAALRARAAWLFAGPDAVLCGVSAAAVHGVSWLDANAPAEVVRTNRRAPAGLRVRSYALSPDDICEVDGMRLTTVARTVFDLGRSLSFSDAVPIMDALLHHTGLDPGQVWSLVDAHPGIRGIDRLRAALSYADGSAGSPLQSRTRMMLRNVGIPGLETRIPILDQWGMIGTHAAMGWPRLRVAVECDEALDSADPTADRTWVHAHTADLEDHGWVVVWVTEPMMSRQRAIVARVREKLFTALRRRAS